MLDDFDLIKSALADIARALQALKARTWSATLPCISIESPTRRTRSRSTRARRNMPGSGRARRTPSAVCAMSGEQPDLVSSARRPHGTTRRGERRTHTRAQTAGRNTRRRGGGALDRARHARARSTTTTTHRSTVQPGSKRRSPEPGRAVAAVQQRIHARCSIQPAIGGDPRRRKGSGERPISIVGLRDWWVDPRGGLERRRWRGYARRTEAGGDDGHRGRRCRRWRRRIHGATHDGEHDAAESGRHGEAFRQLGVLRIRARRFSEAITGIIASSRPLGDRLYTHRPARKSAPAMTFVVLCAFHARDGLAGIGLPQLAGQFSWVSPQTRGQTTPLSRERTWVRHCTTSACRSRRSKC